MPHHIQDFSNPPGDFRNPESATCLRSNERKNHMKTIANNMHPGFALVAFACLALLALLSNSTGTQNTANGAFALFSDTTESFNTATRFQALFKIPATAATTTWLLPIKRFLPTEVAARI
jgi:hypothetical protein